MSVVRHWWLVTDPGDGHAFAVENSESFADYAAEAGDVEVVDVVEAKQLQGAINEALRLECALEQVRARFNESDMRGVRETLGAALDHAGGSSGS